MKKKGQLEAMFTWMIALIVIAAIFMFFMVWMKPWQAIDHAISPKIDPNYCSGGKCATDIPPIARRNQGLVPVIMIFGVLTMAVLASLRKDPNYPQQ